MYETVSPLGEAIFIAEDLIEDYSSFTEVQLDEALSFYRENGYVVLRDLIPKSYCLETQQSFNKTIKTYTGALPRSNGEMEVNNLNDQGFVMNALMNAHQQPNKIIADYIQKTLTLLTHLKLKQTIAHFLGGKNIGLLTWNNFEGNPVTVPHHDCYFWGDDLKVGEVVGAWIALEDIHPGAGRLFVYPGSHKHDMKDFLEILSTKDCPLNPGEPQYLKLITDLLKTSALPCKAPLLRTGDVLFWDSRTIHGSLETSAPKNSRASFTAHYSLDEGRFVPAHSTKTKVNGVSISYIQFSFKNFLSSKLPALRKPYQMCKNLLKRS